MKVNDEGTNSRAMLNRLHFDFRNAKPTFLGVPYLKVDDLVVKLDVGPQKPELSFGESIIEQVEQNGVKHVEANDARGGEILQCKTGSAVQVDDGDSDQLPVVSDAATIQLHSSSGAIVPEPECTLFNTERMQSGHKVLPCSMLENKTSPPVIASSPSSLVQVNKPAEVTHAWEHAKRPKWTEDNFAGNKTAVTLPDSTDEQIEPLSARVNETYSLRENVKLALRSANCSTAKLSDSFGCSESRITSATSSVVLCDDDFDSAPKKKRKRKGGLRPARCVKKSVRTKNAAKAAGVKTDVDKESKPKLVRTPRKRRMVKSDSDDDVWSLRKKLLLMPVNKTMSKSSCGTKQGSRDRKDICASTRKLKGHKSACVVGIETLPDLGVKLEPDGTDITEVLKMSSWQSDVDNDTSAENVPRKWHIDITGADLTTDLDIDYGRITQGPGTDKQKYLVGDKVNERNVGHLVSAADTDCCYPNISTSPETPPPSVASGSFSSCDDFDQSVQEEEPEFSDSHWLNFDTILARYIDGRRFNRLVNGISVRVPTTLSDETQSQIGQECLSLSKLTKHDIKQLQEQVRLEEVYHRRAKKSVLSVSASNRRVSSCSSRQRSVSDRVHRSRSRFETKARSTGGTENESAQAFGVNHHDSSFSVDDGLCPLAADVDNDEEPYLSSDNEAAKLNNKPDGTCKSELLKGNVAGASQEAIHSLASVDDADQHESACVSVLVRIRRSIAAVRNKSQRSEQCGEPPSVGQTSSQSKDDSSTVAKSDFLVPDNALSCQKSGSTADSLCTRIAGLVPADDRSTTLSRQQSMVNTVSAETNISYLDTTHTGDSEYIAALALASLSVAAESPLHFSSVSASKAFTEAAANYCQTEEEIESTQKDIDVDFICKPTCNSAPVHLMKLSSSSKSVASETVTTSSVKSSDPNVKSSELHSESGTKRRHVSFDSRHEHTQKSVNNAVSASTRLTSESHKTHKSHHRKSHSSEASGHTKRVTEGKEKSSTNYSSKSVTYSNNNSSCMATSKINKKNPEMSRTASDVVSRKNDHAASDKMRHIKHRNGSHHHSGKSQEIRHPEKKQVAGSSLEIRDSSASRPTKIDSGSSNVSVSKFDVSAKIENVDGAITVTSTVTASNSMLCTSLSNCVPVLLHTSQNILRSDDAVDNYDKTVSGGKTKTALNSLQMPVNLTSSLSAENPHVLSGMEVGEATTVHEAFSDIDINNVLIESPMVLGATNEQCIDADVSGIMSGANVLISAAVPDECLPGSCSVAKDSDKSAHSETPNSTTLADYSPQSPTCPYRELEEIRSPSPMAADLEKDDDEREIRSPSPCDMESPVAVFRVVETSWDVKLSSPCEIQSPDVSEDEAEDTVEMFSRHCNVCFQHGPLTIPLTAEETSGQT